MKYLTMVARSGDPKGPSGSMIYTLVGDDFSINTMKGDKLAAAINDKKINVTNMSVGPKGLVSTNGAINKYTTIDQNGNIVGTPHCVILNRIEVNGKLAGYVIFTHTGIITKVSVADAASLATQGLVANGKVRHTDNGDIVASISGNYPLVEKQLSEAKEEPPVIDLVFFGSAISGSKFIKFGGITITSKSAKTIAKAFSKLNEENTKLRTTLANDFGYTQEELKSFEVKQAPGAGFYGVYPEYQRSYPGSVDQKS